MKRIAIILICFTAISNIKAQERVITTGVPFLLIAADSLTLIIPCFFGISNFFSQGFIGFQSFMIFGKKKVNFLGTKNFNTKNILL